MFWPPAPYNASVSAWWCNHDFGVTPKSDWARINWGGNRLSTLSNVVFSNGLLDPWIAGGVVNDLSPSVVAVIIEVCIVFVLHLWF